MKRFIITVLGSLLAFPVLAAVDSTQWEFSRDINTTRSGLTVVELDAQAFASMKSDVADVRIVDAAGAEQPYVLQVEKEVKQSSLAGARLLNRAYVADGGYQQFELDLGTTGVLHSRVAITTPEENFQYQIQVYGRNDGEWKLLKGGGVMFDYTNEGENIHAEQLSVLYPESSFRHLQVRIFSGSEFQVSTAKVFATKIRKAKDASYDVVFDQSVNEDGNTVIDIDLGYDQLPANKITLKTKEKNFDRPAQVWAQNDEGDYDRVYGREYLFRYDTDAFAGENLTLEFSDTSAQHLRVVVLNGDDTPISFSGATVSGSVRSVIFEAGDDEYELLYGNPRATRPKYDIERRLKFINVANASTAVLGVEVVNAEFVPVLAPFTERMPWLLPLVLVLASVLLMGMMVRHLKAVRK